MKSFSSLILFIFLIITSCSQVKKLTVVNNTTMNNFLEKNKANDANQLLINDFLTYKKIGKQGYLTIPKVLFFNKEGFSIDYINPKNPCSQDPLFFLKDFDKNKDYTIDKNLKLDDFIKSFHSINGKSSFKKSADTELYVFINWGSFAKKVNEDSLDLLKNKKEGVDFYLINIEPQENWNLTQEQIKQLKL